MKVPPKRKGNIAVGDLRFGNRGLNESPSEKEGKSTPPSTRKKKQQASMKVPPKRKGNRVMRAYSVTVSSVPQ